MYHNTEIKSFFIIFNNKVYFGPLLFDTLAFLTYSAIIFDSKHRTKGDFMSVNSAENSFCLKNISYITRTNPKTGLCSSHEGKRKIFISYKHSDEKKLGLCKKLADYILEKFDVAIWYDRQLTAGEEYDNEIKKAILASDVFVLLLTTNILESNYVLEEELTLARKSQIAILPLIAGLWEKDIAKIEEYIGRVHMPVWFFGQQDSTPVFPNEARDQFFSGIQLSIASKDLIEQAKQFYEKGAYDISLRHLTPEQMFIKAYGHLFDVCPDSKKDVGIRLLESILNIYDGDSEFSRLQAQAGLELAKHLYRTNAPLLLFSLLSSEISKENELLHPLLFNIFRSQWNSDLICSYPQLSMLMFEILYRNNFAEKWDYDDVINKAKKQRVEAVIAENSDAPHIGEIIGDGHKAYLRKSSNDTAGVELIIDAFCVGKFDVYASCGDVYTLFLAYDSEHKCFITIYADFDHYGPETITTLKIYKTEDDKVTVSEHTSEWVKGLKKLPYGPYTFNIK